MISLSPVHIMIASILMTALKSRSLAIAEVKFFLIENLSGSVIATIPAIGMYPDMCLGFLSRVECPKLGVESLK